jgi:hypothetical protein
MFFVKDRVKNYAKKQLLGSNVVLGMVGQLVENVVCTLLETIFIGSITFVMKTFLSPWTATDVVIDIGANVTYVLFGMVHVRHTFHTLFKKPCQAIARKVLGLDIRDPWAFLKIKYTIMCSIMGFVLVGVHSVQNIGFFVSVLCFETFVIQLSVDTWQMFGEDIVECVATNMEPVPTFRVLTIEPVVEIEPHVYKQEEEEEEESKQATPRILGAMILDDQFAI